ncbi:MAG: hypothetical protein ACTHNW_18805 [Mucilaginibacter sp.]
MKNAKIVFFFFLVGCMRNPSLEQTLTKDSDKSFWVEQKEAKDGNLVYTNNQWVFYANGSAQCLVSFNPKRKGTAVILNFEGPSDCKWSYNLQDNILNISTIKYKITKYNTDTISISTLSGDQFVLIRHKTNVY